MQPRILVTCANGIIGREVVERLGHMNVEIRAAVMNPAMHDEKIAAPHVEIVPFDFTDTGSIRRSLDNIEKVLLVTPLVPQIADFTGSFLEIARSSGNLHIVRMSMMGVDIYPRIEFTKLHSMSEDLIARSGIPFTVLRPNLFMQNFLKYLHPEGDNIYLPFGEGKVSYIDARDAAAAVSEVLLDTSRYKGGYYDLTGPESLSMQDVADKITQVTGRRIGYADISDEIVSHALKIMGFSEWKINGMLEYFAWCRSGLLERKTRAIEELTAFAPVPFIDFVRDNAAAFRNLVLQHS